MARFTPPSENVWHQFLSQGMPQITKLVEGARAEKRLEKREEKEDFMLIAKSLFEMASQNAVKNPKAAESMFDNVLDFLGENDFGKLTEGLSMIAQGQKDAAGLLNTAKLSRAETVRKVRSGELSPGDALQTLTQLGYGDSNEAKFITKWADDPMQFDNPALAADMKLLKDIMQSIRDPYTGLPVEGMYEKIEPEATQIFDRVIKHFKGEKTPPPEGKVIWDQLWDTNTQRPYYVNKETKETSWTVGAGDSVNVVHQPKIKKPTGVKFNTREGGNRTTIGIEWPPLSGQWVEVNKKTFNIATGVESAMFTDPSKKKLAEMLGTTLEELIQQNLVTK